jgi:hypothetical protein
MNAMARIGSPFAVPLVLLLSVCAYGDTDYERGCSSDAECKVVVSCCDGCFSIRVEAELSACDTACLTDPCDLRFGVTDPAALEAVCHEGLCAARVREE